ncbi:erythroid differentiation-related factor 1 [Anopheles nili]|uniref:erythroid differentiation-related factor 1 n=1 Tax=Anopheles nili TaxID=185578 RepID=UPI00237B74F4|nr:erythroid differentiation-related factor 1 [Anopheles nili]
MDDAEIELCPRVPMVAADGHPVKSNAIVRFSVAQNTVPFARLKCNTNLNVPPSNWLTNSANSYGLGQFLSHQEGFSSFRMANMFPDCVGGVDVISDAENIKRLLKLPYSRKSVISMIVHRIETTLLIDEFDVAKYLLRQEEAEWQWLRSFIYENIFKNLSNSERKLFLLHPKSRAAFQQKYLTSKFLYHSLQSGEREDVAKGDLPDVMPNDCAPYTRLPPVGPMLPDPSKDEHYPETQRTNHVFNRNVIWTFEDIRMLIGTDMPIFGGANRPCISLRLRDESKPINVLTGIDYWLDNLMSNVPEVVMCYHLDGIVQRYELIKTEDLPGLENSEFSPQLIRNVAQNILAFLKANVTKAGHTYWLFKARNDDVVKLYDLTTLCKAHDGTSSPADDIDANEDEKEKLPSKEPPEMTSNQTQPGRSPAGQNPFTIPVAMLLYTVARNMKHSVESGNLSASKAGAIRTLLNNCIKLLPKEKYPQIVTSSHYILSDLHIPADTDPASPKFNATVEDEDDDEAGYLFGERNSTPSENGLDEAEDEGPIEAQGQREELGSGKFETAIKSIQDTLKEYKLEERLGKHHNSRPAPLLCETTERCSIALQHIVDGLHCLQYFDSYEEQKQREKEKEAERQKIIHEETHPTMAKQDNAIPLPYQPLHPEAQSADPQRVIPMGWKEATQVGSTNRVTGPEQNASSTKATKKRAKRKTTDREPKGSIPKQQEEGGGSSSAAPSAEVDPRALLLKGQIGVFESWNVHLKILLFEKACLVYATKAEQQYAHQRYGATLRDLYSAIRCEQVVMKYISCVASQRSLLLGRAGDCFFQMAKEWKSIEEYLTQFAEENRLDQLLMEELMKDIGSELENTLPVPTNNIELLMITSCSCYEAAIGSATKETRDEPARRLGSVRNELGVKYMHWAQEEYHKYWDAQVESSTMDEEVDAPEPQYQVLVKKSYDSLQKGVALFEAINDTTNLALLLCNMGRFMRFRAHIHLIGERPNNVNAQKKFYHEAFGYYQRALGMLGTRKKHPDLWSLFTWELSTATFNLAKQLQDHSVIPTDGHSQEEVEKEMVEMLQRALKLCDQDNSGPKQVLYSFRAALIHHRIASYYHMSYRSTSDEHRRKAILKLAKLHYEKAANTFKSLAMPQEFLHTQMERIGLQDNQCEQVATSAAKTRHLLVSLDLCKQSLPLVEQLACMKSHGPDEDDLSSSTGCTDGSGGRYEELQKLLQLLEKQLQVILRTLTQHSLLAAGGDRKDAAAHYKALFAVALQRRSVESQPEDVHLSEAGTGSSVIKEYALHLSRILRQICDLDHDYESGLR